MEREKAIRLLQKEIDALRKNIQEDSDLDEEQRASRLPPSRPRASSAC